MDEPIVTNVRALLQPRPLAEIRTERRFEQVDEVTAAAGIKIAAPDLDEAMAGAPVWVIREQPVETVVEAVKAELAEVEVATEDEGVVVKADTLGSLEALANALEEVEVPIMRAEVGDVAARDVAVARTADDPLHRAILGFNVDVLSDAEREADEQDVRVFVDDVIYQLVEDYEAYVEEIESAQQKTILENITRPARFRILDDHVFRQSNPAVVGVEIAAGTLKRNVHIAKFDNGEPDRVGRLQGIQSQGEDLEQARSGERVSVAIEGPTVGRQIDEGDELWVDLPEKHAKILEQELVTDLPADEREALKAYLDTRRQQDPFWAK
jgi:translation initiation factor 5B